MRAVALLELAWGDCEGPCTVSGPRVGGLLERGRIPRAYLRGHPSRKLSDESLRLTGLWAIRCVTHAVVLDVEYAGQTKHPWGNERAAFTAMGIEVEVEAVKQTATRAA